MRRYDDIWFEGRIDGHGVEGFGGSAGLALVGVDVAGVIEAADERGQGGQEHREEQGHGEAEGEQIAQQLFADEKDERRRSITPDPGMSRLRQHCI